MNVTAATVHTEFLDRAMDARALNLEQHRLIHDPSDEVDSLVEVFEVLHGEPHHRVTGVQLLQQITVSNTREGVRVAAIAGTADKLATDLRHLELNAGPRGVLAGKGIAKRLREPLRALSAQPELAGAWADVHRLAREIPRVQLLSRTVRYELGEQKFRMLEAMVDGLDG